MKIKKEWIFINNQEKSKKTVNAKKTSSSKKAENAKPNEAKKKKSSKSILKKIGYWIGVLICVGIIAGSSIAIALTLYLVDATKEDDINLTNLELSFTSTIYYQDKETGEYLEYTKLGGTENRTWVSLADIPQHVQDAYIAVEDEGFYEHMGFDLVGTVASAVNEYTPIQLFDSQRGASTLTQQLIKNITFDSSSTGIDGALRKVREIYRAIVLESEYSKDEILEAYLNTHRLSGQLAGVQAGANYYFSKDISELTVAEAALLAGITKNPSQYNPFLHEGMSLDDPDNASVARRNDILFFMHEQGKIDTTTYEAALVEPVNLATENKIVEENSYFTDMVINQVVEDLMAEYDMTSGEAEDYLYNSGLKIYSTVEPELQTAMEYEMSNVRDPQVFDMTENIYTTTDADGNEVEITQTPQGAMVSMDYEGRIVAVVGGIGEKEGDRVLNRAVDSVRQTGSTMKPIGSYALAIDYGYVNYSSPIYDAPFAQEKDSATGVLRDWPSNYSQSYLNADIPLQVAVAKSLNTTAVRALSYVTPAVSYEFLETTLGISSLDPVNDVDYGPLALGSMTTGVSPLEMAAAYAIFGNGGTYYEPYCYTTVEDSNGQIILESSSTSVRAISDETAYIMNRMLRTVLRTGDGTGYGLAPDYMDAIGKTGTTSDNKDHWFIGLTPYYVTATWWGYDEPASLNWKGGYNYRSHPPTTAWRNVMNAVQEDMEAISFPTSSGVVIYNYCRDSGGTANPTCPTQITGYYTPDNMPIPCHLHA